MRFGTAEDDHQSDSEEFLGPSEPCVHDTSEDLPVNGQRFCRNQPKLIWRGTQLRRCQWNDMRIRCLSRVRSAHLHSIEILYEPQTLCNVFRHVRASVAEGLLLGSPLEEVFTCGAWTIFCWETSLLNWKSEIGIRVKGITWLYSKFQFTELFA